MPLKSSELRSFRNPAPFAFKFARLDAWYYWVLAAAVLLTTSVLNAPEEPVVKRSVLTRAYRVEGGDGVVEGRDDADVRP